MPGSEIRKLLIDSVPNIEKFFEVSDKLRGFEITIVAAVIAQAYYKSKINEDLDISYWTK